jgi:hypothetical protein
MDAIGMPIGEGIMDGIDMLGIDICAAGFIGDILVK